MTFLMNLWKPAGGWLVIALFAAGCATQRGPRSTTLDAFLSHDAPPAVREKLGTLQPLTLNEITNALRLGVPEQAVLDHVADSRALYSLQTADVDQLRAAGASDHLINRLLATPAEVRRRERVSYGGYHYPHYGYGYGYGYGHGYGRGYGRGYRCY